MAQKRKEAYDLNPRLCLCCSTPITYKQTTVDQNCKFCSQSCAAQLNNRLYPKRLKSERLPKHVGVYKAPKPKLTQQEWREKRFWTYSVPRILDGKVSGRVTLKRALYRLQGRKCGCCEIVEWRGKPTPLELDHIDGNAGNNFLENLRLLCPNCHAQTLTYGKKNSGNGRRSRGLPLQ